MRTIERLAEENARGAPPQRRTGMLDSFRTGCGERLAERLTERRSHTSARGIAGGGRNLPALRPLYASEEEANTAHLKRLGIELRYGSWDEQKPVDVLAHHRGREAAQGISLALQVGRETDTPPARPPLLARKGYQMQFRF